MSVNEDLVDALIAHRLRLLRYEAGVVDKLLRTATTKLGPTIDEILAIGKRSKDGEPLSRTDRDRLRVLRGRVTRQVQALHDALRVELERSLRGAVTAEARAVPAEIAHALPTQLAKRVRVVPLADLVGAIVEPVGGLRWTDRLAQDLLDAHDRIQGVLARAVSEGLSVPNIATRLRAVAGIEATYKGRLVAIARTEIQRVSNHAALRTYAANSDVVGAVQWLATLDTRTCLWCAPLHGKSWTLTEAGELPENAPRPPLHPRCRCFFAPVTRSWKELGIDRDDDRDGSPTIVTSFDAWLRRRPKDEQREVLGDARWSSWAARKLALKSFSDAAGPLSLEALEARYTSFTPSAT